MDVLEKIKRLLKFEWCSQMVANNKEQRDNRESMSELLSQYDYEVIPNYSQFWEDTPQGDDYWDAIDNRLN